MIAAPEAREGHGPYLSLTREDVIEGQAARRAVLSARDREYRIRTRHACLLCRDDEPSALYAGRAWCRACGRLWSWLAHPHP